MSSTAAAAARRLGVVVCGVGGRMGKIRSELIYANPRFELLGVVDTNAEAAERIAAVYSVRTDARKIVVCKTV